MMIGNLEPFNAETTQWSVYIGRLQQFIVLNAISDELQVPLLITTVGKAAYELIVNLCAPASPLTKSFEELVQLVADHLRPVSSEIENRHVFYSRKQQENETITEYLEDLKRLAAMCSFGSKTTENIRDQFVAGLTNTAIQQRIFYEKLVLYREIIELAVTMESDSTQQVITDITTNTHSDLVEDLTNMNINDDINDDDRELSKPTENITSFKILFQNVNKLDMMLLKYRLNLLHQEHDLIVVIEMNPSFQVNSEEIIENWKVIKRISKNLKSFIVAVRPGLIFNRRKDLESHYENDLWLAFALYDSPIYVCIVHNQSDFLDASKESRDWSGKILGFIGDLKDAVIILGSNETHKIFWDRCALTNVELSGSQRAVTRLLLGKKISSAVSQTYKGIHPLGIIDPAPLNIVTILE